MSRIVLSMPGVRREEADGGMCRPCREDAAWREQQRAPDLEDC
jgi:hypothetical protein